MCLQSAEVIDGELQKRAYNFRKEWDHKSSDANAIPTYLITPYGRHQIYHHQRCSFKDPPNPKFMMVGTTSQQSSLPITITNHTDIPRVLLLLVIRLGPKSFMGST